MADACPVGVMSTWHADIDTYMGLVDVLVLVGFWSTLELDALEIHSLGFLLAQTGVNDFLFWLKCKKFL